MCDREFLQLRSESISTSTTACYLNSISNFLIFLYSYLPDRQNDAVAQPSDDPSVSVIEQGVNRDYVCPLTSAIKDLIAGIFSLI